MIPVGRNLLENDNQKKDHLDLPECLILTLNVDTSHCSNPTT